MKFRAAAAVATALALGAGLTGCNMISPQRTEMHYDASDGVSVDLGAIGVRNAILVVDTDTEKTDVANFVVAISNTTNSPANVTAKVQSSTVNITAEGGLQGKLTSIGYGEGGEERVNGTFQSGSVVDVEFTATYKDASGKSVTETATVSVPVLGASEPENVLNEYATMMPTESASPAATATPEPTATDELEPEATTEG